MARPRKTDAPDLSKPVNLTLGVIERLTCPPGKDQAFLRDSEGNGLRIRVTQAGAKSFVFEHSLRNKTIRRTIGNVTAWTIGNARTEAKRLSVLLDEGKDPRELERQRLAEDVAAAERLAAADEAVAVQQVADAKTVREAWERYVAERRSLWSDRHHQDHFKLAQEGGRPRKRAKGKVTEPGPLAALMDMRLIDLTGPAVEAWASEEAKTRPARTRLALRLLKAFLRWASEDADLKGRADPAAASTKKAREAAGRAKSNKVVLQRQQLRPWFDAVRGIQNPIISAYLQCLLLTGRRREQVMELRWEDVNFQWKTITMRDKTEGEITVPLPPYMAHILRGLPHRNGWVFSSVRTVKSDPANTLRRERRHAQAGTVPAPGLVVDGSASGRLMDPSSAHRRACAAADIEGLTLHGLRKSFATLSEWIETPAGIAAQIQGHAPQGVREQYYIRRPLDILRMWHEKIEAWILGEAGIAFDPAAPPVGVRAVAG